MTEDQWPGISRLNTAELSVAALTYARAGLPVFPVFGVTSAGVCECGDAECDRPGKHPRVKWTREATVAEGEVVSWWARWPTANIGLPTGARSGLVVIDLDLAELELTDPDGTTRFAVEDGEAELSQLLERELGQGWDAKRLRELTLAARTGGGGSHLFLRDPAGVGSVTRWLPAVDLRGDGGYVLLTPSRHASGGAYAWQTELAPWVPEARLAGQLRLARGSASPGSRERGRASLSEHGEDGVSVGYREAKRDGPGEGERDEFFNKYAFELRKRGFRRNAAIAELRRVWELTPGGGAPSTRTPPRPYRWETVHEKVKRVWDSVDADPDALALEPVADELNQWAHSAAASVQAPQRPADDPLAVIAETGGTSPDQTGDVPPPRGGGVHVLESELEAERASDLGNGTRFARLFRDRVKYVTGAGWFIWNGTYWKPDASDLVVQLTREVIQDINEQALREGDDDTRNRWLAWALNSESHGRLTAMLKIAATDPRLTTLMGNFDPHRHLLTCPNGTLDLLTGELLPHDPAHLSTNCTGVEYHADAEAHLLDDFHATFLPDAELREYVYALVGSALFGGNRARAFVILQGGTTSGKSTWVAGVSEALGTYAAPVNPSVFRGSMDDKPRPDLLRVMRVRLALAEEAGAAWELHTDQIKRLTGGDVIVARGMNSNTLVERRMEFTPVVVTNELPHLTGMDEAAARRIVTLNFDQTIPADEVDISRKPAFLADEEVRVAILAKLVAGCRGWDDRRGLTVPEQQLRRTREAHEELDTVTAFLRDARDSEQLSYDQELLASSSVGTVELYQEYKRWVRDNRGDAHRGGGAVGSRTFSQKLEALPGWERVRSNGTRWLGWQLAPGSQVSGLFSGL